MYEKEGRQISAVQAESAAKSKGLSLEDWLSETGFISVSGKTTVPEDMTPPTGPEKKTAAGDSSLADTSLESLKVDLLPGLRLRLAKPGMTFVGLASPSRRDPGPPARSKLLFPRLCSGYSAPRYESL